MHAAVAVRPANCWLTINRDWTIGSCGNDVAGAISQAIGQNVWDAFPDSEPIFRPVYEAAWRNGKSAAVLEYNDNLVEVNVFLRHEQLFVSYQSLTVAGLRATLERLVELVEARDSRRTTAAHQRQSASPLRLVADQAPR